MLLQHIYAIITNMDIRDNTNKLLATTRPNDKGESVYSGTMQYLGFTDSRGTFDAQGRQISTTASPGMLIRR
jgi:hypothetical protein